MNDTTVPGAVYVQTNDAERNEVLAFVRNGDGSLESIGAYDTGGRGSGAPHLPSQGSVVLSADGRWLLVANVGSDDVAVFAVAGFTLSEDGGLAPIEGSGRALSTPDADPAVGAVEVSAANVAGLAVS